MANRTANRTGTAQFPQPLDRLALGLMVVLAVLIGLLLLSGDRSAPRVRQFSWQDRQVGAEDTAFTLSFSRPMDHTSVENNLQITPPLKGKFSWSGRRMAYTVAIPAPYGTAFQVKLTGARDRFTGEGANQITNQPFTGNFRSRDRAFAYIGVQGEEAGRLILYNLTQQKKQVLTPANLEVMDFKPYPQSDRLLFAAIEKANQSLGPVEQKLYMVTTGIQVNTPDAPDAQQQQQFWQLWPQTRSQPQEAGKVDLVLDNQDYQNLKFDLSANGQVIVVQRVNRKNPSEFGPWILRAGEAAQPLKTQQPGGDFLITPDSSSLAVAQGQGLAILPLQPEADPLDFLPKFGTVLSFSSDGTAAVMVKFNTDYTRSLFLVANPGVQKEILRTTGSILNAQFDPTNQILYCLLTNLIPGDTYEEEPYLAAIDLKQAKTLSRPAPELVRPLVVLPNQRDIQVSLSADGLALLFDQVNRAKPGVKGQKGGKTIADSRLWILPLPGLPDNSTKIQPELLPMAGVHPRWLP